MVNSAFSFPPSPTYSFEPRHVEWARAHDWFLQDNGNGSVTVQTPVLVGDAGQWYMETVTFLAPKALREWAGY